MKRCIAVKNLSISTAHAALMGMISIFAFACNSPSPPPPISNVVQLEIFHTNDLHSHMKAPQTDPFGLGGLAKLSTLLTQLRAATPNSITLDAGDWSEGTWYYDLDEGANMLEIMSAMKYDAVCLGNHDFLQGPDQLIKTITKAKPSFPVLAANLDMSGYSNPASLLGALPQTFTKTVGGVRIGIIGLTTDGPLYGSYMAPVKVTTALQVASVQALKMRPNVDVLILVSHNDFSENQALAQYVPGVDVVISGHSHVKTPKAVLVTNAGRQVPVVETGSWGAFLGDMKLSVDLTHHTVTMSNYQLHAVTSSLADDPTVAAMVTAQDSALDTKFNLNVDQVVATSDASLLQQNISESLLGNLAVQSYRYATGADMALEEISLTGVSVPQGNVTIRNLHDVVPHIYNPAIGKEWTLNVWNALGSDILLISEAFYTTSGLMPLSSPLNWLSTDNAVIDWNPSGPVPTITSIQIGGLLMNPTSRYTVAMTDGLLFAIQSANTQLHLGLDLSQVTNTGTEAWRAVLAYGESLQHLTLSQLGVGRTARTTTADLAIFYYDTTVDGKNLNVIVHNNGLITSQTSVLTCNSGKSNDSISYNSYPTDLETWTKIGSVNVAAIAAGGTSTVSIPWNQSALAPGYWPVKCDLVTTSDPYDVDNHVLTVFHF